MASESQALLRQYDKKEISIPMVLDQHAMQQRNDDSDEVYYCGLCGWHPRCLQVFNSPKWALVFVSMAAFIQGAVVNGMLHYFISTIEKRYEMPSYQSGLMSGAFDVASLLCLIPVTYFGGRRSANKPRYIATGLLVVGIGSFIFFTPYLLSGLYSSKVINDLCATNSTLTTGMTRGNEDIIQGPTFCSPDLIEFCKSTSKNRFSIYFWILFIGNFLHGAGGTPLFTLSVTFIDESVSQDQSALYIGIYYILALIGPGVGYAVGGCLIRLYVDFPYIKEEDLNIYPDNPSWVGCWWLGFLLFSIIAVLMSLVIYSMPKELKDTKRLRAEKDAAAGHNYASKEEVPYQTFRELPGALGALLCNMLYMSICLVGCCEGLLLAGFGAFMPKILEMEFNLGPTSVAVVMGTVALPSALIGLLVGGIIVNRLRLDLRQTLLLCISCIFLSIMCVPGLLLGCPMDSLVGINHPFYENRFNSSQRYSLVSDCNSHCCCSDLYSPVCGQDNLQYFSACYAGCNRSISSKSFREFFECSCIPLTEGWKPGLAEASSLPCTQDCPLFPVFIFLLFFYHVFTFTACVPAISAMLRSVNVNLKSLAMGVQWILSRLLGTIPGPVLFGVIMDSTCHFWHSPLCISKGVCLTYDHVRFRWFLVGVTTIWKAMQIIFFLIAYFLAGRNGKPGCLRNVSTSTSAR